MGERTKKRYKPKPYRITFEEGHELEDLEVHARRMSVGDALELMELGDLAREVADRSAVMITEGHKKAVEAVIARMADVITWWNVDEVTESDDGEEAARPVTPDEEGLRSQDLTLVMAVFEAYFDRVASVAPPLPDGSPGGPNPAGQAIPMETLLPGHGS